MKDVEDPAFTTLAELVVDIAREIQLRAAQSTPVVPLTPTQGQVMRYVHNHAGCSASDIADGAGLQRANVSTALRELRRRGYLTSRRADDDGRAIRIEATPLADETIIRLRASWASLVAGAWQTEPAIGDDDALTTVTAALAGVRSRLSADRATKAFPSAPSRLAAAGADSIRPR